MECWFYDNPSSIASSPAPEILQDWLFDAFYTSGDTKNAAFRPDSSPSLSPAPANLYQLQGFDFSQQSSVPAPAPAPRRGRPPASSSSSSSAQQSVGRNSGRVHSSPPGTPASKPAAPSKGQPAIKPSPDRRSIQFPNSKNDEEVLTKAMLAVISSSSPPPTPAPAPAPATQSQRSKSRLGVAFKPFDASLSPKPPKMKNASAAGGGQRMFNSSISMMKKIHSGCQFEVQNLGTPPPELVRRPEQGIAGDESFRLIRSLLPPDCKQDKASILSSAKECLEGLRAEISELENDDLGLQLLPGEDEECRRKKTKLCVEVARMAPAMAAAVDDSGRWRMRINVAITADNEEFDVMELVLRVLQRIKEMQIATVVSVQGAGAGGSASTLVLDLEAGDSVNEGFLKEMIAGALQGGGGGWPAGDVGGAAAGFPVIMQ